MVVTVERLAFAATFALVYYFTPAATQALQVFSFW